MGLSASDELFHTPTSTSVRWHEQWRFEFAAADASLGGWLAVTRWPNAGRASYHAFLVGHGRQLLAVVDDDISIGPATLEFRSDALWGDHICETPFEHWTIGLEAFALGVDDADEVIGRGYGDRVALGFDLEWETTAAPTDDGLADRHGYRQDCTVSGEILVGREEIDFVGVGARAHTWGDVDWWGPGRHALPTTDARAVATTKYRLVDPAGGDRIVVVELVPGVDGTRWVEASSE